MFNELKTAQAAAYLLHKAGGQMHHLKLMKLLYLADRLSWKERDYSISGDSYYSLPFGPVLSQTLNLMRGETLSRNLTEWDNWISDKANHQVSIVQQVNNDDEYFWSELSLSDTDILDNTFEEYGHLDRFELVDLTHNPEMIPEWQDPKGSSIRITLEQLLTCLGKNSSQIQSILEEQKEMAEINSLFKGNVCQ